MSPRKRIRKTHSDSVSLGVSAISQPSATTQPSDVIAASVMARSPNSSAASSIAESSVHARRHSSLRDSKNKTRSWYGSWPRVPKSSASTQLATEPILGGTLKPKASSDLRRYGAQRPSVANDDCSSDEAPTLRSPPDCPTPPSPAPPTPSDPRAVNLPRAQSATSLRKEDGVTIAGINDVVQPDQKPTGDHELASKASTEVLVEAECPPNAPTPPAPGWFSWLSRAAPVETREPATDERVSTPVEVIEEDEEQEDPQPQEPEQGQQQEQQQEEQQEQESSDQQDPSTPPDDVPTPTTAQSALSERVWSYLWYGSGASTSPAAVQPEVQPAAEPPVEPSTKSVEDTQNTSIRTARTVAQEESTAPIPVPTPLSPPGTPASTAPAIASAGSTWAFWSRDTRQKTAATASATASTTATAIAKPSSEPAKPEHGEIAVIGERSEASPKPVAGIEVKEPVSKASSVKEVAVKGTATFSARDSRFRKSKRLRAQSMGTGGEMSPSEPLLPTDASSSTPKQAAASAKQVQTRLKTPPPNLLLPSFQSTYQYKENASLLGQMARFLLRMQQPAVNHLFLAKEPPKIKKAVAIGVHGLFPAAYLRPMIGQPTGTSIRFANHGAEALRRWADSHGSPDCEIEKVALEGEGKIFERVDNLWKLLLNWVDHLRDADFILLACHSQGVPVGIMLLAKLIDMGLVPKARIGVCAMAGVSLGPFPDYKSGLGILMGSAGELWDFSNPQSEVTKRYEHSLKAVLEYGVRITFVGSIDDQVVPLESAIYSPVHHPYVYRAVFVDGRIHAPDFIAHLIGFACKLRNLGISDHGLVKELSVPLAGSLYSGEGHSRVYDDTQVYDLAMSHALETEDMGHVACEIKKHDGLANPNPYHLPWILRGMLEEDYVKTELHMETTELVRHFDEWKPVTKALKDVKYRLEAVRSKL